MGLEERRETLWRRCEKVKKMPVTNILETLFAEVILFRFRIFGDF